MLQTRRRRMLYERAFSAGRRSAKENITFSLKYNGAYLLLRWPISLCLTDSTIAINGNLNLHFQDESKQLNG